MNFHSGPRFQRGRGLGSIFSALFRSLRPLASMGLKAGKRILNSDIVKNIGSTALDATKDAVKNIAVDLLEGKNIKESANQQLEEAKSKLAQTLRGSGRKRRKKKNISNCVIKKSKYNLLE